MLYLSVGGLLACILGAIFIKVLPRLATLGVILAFIGASLFICLGVATIRDDQSKTAKCASLDGHFGGGSCYVAGVEKDLNNLEDFVKKEF